MKGKLSNSKLSEELDGFVNSNVVIANFVQFVLQQADVKYIAAIENLPDHQKLAKKHAQFWKDSVKPKIQQSLNDTIYFSEVFLEKCDALQSLIDQMKKKDDKAKDEFTVTIKVLMGNLNVVIAHTKDVVASVGKFKSILNEDMRDFQQDVNEAQKKLIGDNKEKHALQNQLNAINKAIDRDYALIGASVVCPWFAVDAGIDLKKQESAKGDVDRKLAKEKNEIRVLSAVKGQIDGFLKAIPPVANAAASLEGGWSALKNDCEEVVTELKSLSTTKAADYLGPLLETAKKDWAVVLAKAKQLQPVVTTNC